MSKLRTYNEYLFAALGTLVVAGMVLVGAAIAIEMVFNFFGGDGPDELITDEEVQQAAEQGLRLQAASYQMPERLFEKRPWYVIPVGQRTLAEPEKRAALAANFSGGYSSEYRYSYWGDTNNLVVWNEKTGASELVLPERRRVVSHVAYLEHGEPYLLILAERIADDDDVDGLRVGDRALWVYGLEEARRTKIELPGEMVSQIDTLDEAELAFALVGEDRNGDGVYNGDREPTLLYRVNAEAGTLEPMVPDAIRVRAQNILDGGANEARD